MTDRNLRLPLPSPTSLFFLTAIISLFAALPVAAANFPMRPPYEITVDAPDTSVELVARLEIPHKDMLKSAKAPLVVLIHQFGMDGYKWGVFPEELLRAGFAFLSVDLRGHGLSIYDLKLHKNRPPYSYRVDEFQKFPSDIGLLIQDAIKYHLEALDTNKIAIIGAALGANVGTLYAQTDPRVKYLALISPGLEHQGLRIAPVLREFDDRPILIAYSHKDIYSSITVDLLTDVIPREFDIFLSESMYAGNRLLNAEPSLQGKILQDLRKYLLEQK